MNNHQRDIIKLARLNVIIYRVSFYKAKKMANKTYKSIGDMLVRKYAFKRN